MAVNTMTSSSTATCSCGPLQFARVQGVTPATLPQRDHPAGAPAQLLDHRPYRSRQVDAGRSAARDDPHDRGALDDEPGPRLDGSGAREGDYDQGAGGPPCRSGAGRPDLWPEPDRHTRTRRLLVRSQPIATGL